MEGDVRGSGGRISRRAVVWKAVLLIPNALAGRKAGFDACLAAEFRMEEVMGLDLVAQRAVLAAVAMCRTA